MNIEPNTCYFVLLSITIVAYSCYFFFKLQRFEEMVVRVHKSVHLSVHQQIPEHLLMDLCNGYLNLLKHHLTEVHSLAEWRAKRFSFGLLFVLYTLFPLFGVYWIGFSVDEPFISYYLRDGGIEVFLKRNAQSLTLLRIWSLCSIFSLVGLICAYLVSIRKMRKKYLTGAEQKKFCS